MLSLLVIGVALGLIVVLRHLNRDDLVAFIERLLRTALLLVDRHGHDLGWRGHRHG